jgi:hypothetical protein
MGGRALCPKRRDVSAARLCHTDPNVALPGFKGCALLGGEVVQVIHAGHAGTRGAGVWLRTRSVTSRRTLDNQCGKFSALVELGQDPGQSPLGYCAHRLAALHGLTASAGRSTIRRARRCDMPGRGHRAEVCSMLPRMLPNSILGLFYWGWFPTKCLFLFGSPGRSPPT